MRKWFIAIGALLGGLVALVWQISQHKGNVKASRSLAIHMKPVYVTKDVKEWESEIEKKSKEITKAIENGRKEEIRRRWKESFGEHSSLSH